MAHQDIPDLDRAGLRKFGITTGAMFVLLFGALFPYVFEYAFPIWPWVILAVLGLWGLAAPDTLGPVYRLWMGLALLLNRVTTPLVLGIVFFVVLFPLSLIMRMVRPDPLSREFRPDAETYRSASSEISDESIKNPF